MRMPIVIHSRDADKKTMDILKEEGAFSEERCGWFPARGGAGDARVLLHCFSGSRELGREYVKLGATLSIAGPITYKNNRKTVEMGRRHSHGIPSGRNGLALSHSGAFQGTSQQTTLC